MALVDNLGYMKNRNEFETEYENDAELLIRDVTFDEDDDPQDRGMFTLPIPPFPSLLPSLPFPPSPSLLHSHSNCRVEVGSS